ncbi:MAG: hypothetical protein HY033_12095 [Ignavibacteriae bacterium]|nr:hypothetical protein [Ignavibacteria bacterium]MBI3365634.1 hypothetical protein [Ignavibacteriota bacterium]
MQDKYAGDVGDFGKFVLLRQLSQISSRQVRLAINWYRTDKVEQGSGDGRYTSYLDPSYSKSTKFSECDTTLFGILKRVVNNSRSIHALEQSGILPSRTTFFSKPLPFQAVHPSQRAVDRESWFRQSLSVFQTVDVGFLDPDNGIQTPKVKSTQTRSIKYALLNEIQTYLQACQLLIVYNHRDRTPSDRYVQRFTQIRDHIDPSAQIKILRFKRFSVRDYVFFYKRSFAGEVHTLFRTLAAAPFDFLFEEVKLK